MKIIQIIDVRWYNASADFAVTQAGALAGKGHEVLLVANPGSPPAAKAKEAGLEVCEDIDFSGANVIRSAGELVNVARRFNPDIVFAHRGESHLAAAMACRRIGCHVARFRGDLRLPRRGIFSRILNEKYTHGIAVSTTRLGDEYKRIYRLDGIPVRVIYPGIDGSRFQFAESREELKREFGLDPNLTVIGIVGRLSPVKGHEYFLKAAKIIHENHPEIQFVIAGGDAQLSAKSLAGEAAELGLNNVRFTGKIDKIDRLISAFDIGVVASIGSEMICRVLMEYFAAGIAVVATRINQVEELMSLSKGGILVPAGDAQAMAAAILQLYGDDAGRQEISACARRWVVENRSLRELAEDTDLFLEEVISA